VAEPLIVEAPSADLARALIQRLQAFPTELGDDGGCDVCITLTGNVSPLIAADIMPSSLVRCPTFHAPVTGPP